MPARKLALALTFVAALAWAQSRVTCGPASGTCGPAIVGVPGGAVTTTTASTTTTLAGTAAPSWVPSMLAAWMLDETSGTRVNLQGTTTRDLANVDTSDPGSSTDHQEGTRSMSIVAAQARHTTDTFSTLNTTQSMGCWVKMATPSAEATFMMHHYQDGVSGTTKLSREPGGWYQFKTYLGVTATTALSTAQPDNVWTHVVGTFTAGATISIYINGVGASGPFSGASSATANPFYLGDNFTFTGLIDECWVVDRELAAQSICRICSCGIRGEQCTCAGTAWASLGRNVTACGSCTLPATCNTATPP